MAGLVIPITVNDAFSGALEAFEKTFTKATDSVSEFSDKLDNVVDGMGGASDKAGSADSNIDKLDKSMGGAEKGAFSFGSVLQNLYFGLGLIEKIVPSVTAAFDKIEDKERALVLLGKEGGNALYDFSEKTAKAMGRSAQELASAGVEWAKAGIGGNNIKELMALTDRMAKLNGSSFGDVASKLKDAVKSKSVSGVGDLLGGGSGVETMLKRAGMERALNSGNVKQAIAIYEKVADKLGYTQAAANKLNDTIGAKFARISNRIKDSFNQMFSMIAQKLSPAISKIIETLDNPEFQNAFDKVSAGVGVAAEKIGALLIAVVDISSKVADFISRNAELIKSIAIVAAMTAGVYALGVAFAAAKAAVIAFKVAMVASGGVVGMFSKLSGALLAHPFVVAIAALGLFAVIMQKVLEKLTGETLSIVDIIIGIVVGGLTTIGEFLYNAATGLLETFLGVFVVPVWNSLVSFGEFFANLFNDPIGALFKLFTSFAVSIIDKVISIGTAINKVFGSDTISKAVDSLKGLTDTLNENADSFTKPNYKSFEGKKTSSGSLMAKLGIAERVEYGEWSAKAMGWAIGKKNELFGGDKEEAKKTDDIIAGASDKLSGIKEDSSKIRDSVARKQDLRWMKELAEKSFTSFVNVRTLTPNVSVTMNGSNMNPDDVGKVLEKQIIQMMAASANGSYGEV